MGESKRSISAPVLGIDPDGGFKVLYRPGIVFRVELKIQLPSLLKCLSCINLVSLALPDLLLITFRKFDSERLDNLPNELVLDGKDVPYIPIVAFRPNVPARQRID